MFPPAPSLFFIRSRPSVNGATERRDALGKHLGEFVFLGVFFFSKNVVVSSSTSFFFFFFFLFFGSFFFWTFFFFFLFFFFFRLFNGINGDEAMRRRKTKTPRRSERAKRRRHRRRNRRQTVDAVGANQVPLSDAVEGAVFVRNFCFASPSFLRPKKMVAP